MQPGQKEAYGDEKTKSETIKAKGEKVRKHIFHMKTV